MDNITNKIKVKGVTISLLVLAILTMGIISVLNDFSILDFSIDKAQMISALLLTFVGAEIAWKTLTVKKPTVGLVIAGIWIVVFIPFVLAFFNYVTPVLSGITGVMKSLLLVGAIWLAFTK